jgi:hypothetical protein
MNEQHDGTPSEKNDATESEPSTAQQISDAAPAADEFRLTIRKLEMPVRPRGVLAD